MIKSCGASHSIIHFNYISLSDSQMLGIQGALHLQHLFLLPTDNIVFSGRYKVRDKWYIINGKFTKTGKKYNSKAVYQHIKKNIKFCIFFMGHWKINLCARVKANDNDSQGLAYSNVKDVRCPDNIGLQWRFYKDPVGTEIKVRCA